MVWLAILRYWVNAEWATTCGFMLVVYARISRISSRGGISDPPLPAYQLRVEAYNEDEADTCMIYYACVNKLQITDPFR